MVKVRIFFMSQLRKQFVMSEQVHRLSRIGARILTQTISEEVKRINNILGEGHTSPYFFVYMSKKSIRKTWGKIRGSSKTWGETWDIKLWGKIWGWGKSWGGVHDVNMG